MKVYCDGVEQTGHPNVDNWPLSDEFHVDDNTRVIGIECTDAGQYTVLIITMYGLHSPALKYHFEFIYVIFHDFEYLLTALYE